MLALLYAISRHDSLLLRKSGSTLSGKGMELRLATAERRIMEVGCGGRVGGEQNQQQPEPEIP